MNHEHWDVIACSTWLNWPSQLTNLFSAKHSIPNHFLARIVIFGCCLPRSSSPLVQMWLFGPNETGEIEGETTGRWLRFGRNTSFKIPMCFASCFLRNVE